ARDGVTCARCRSAVGPATARSGAGPNQGRVGRNMWRGAAVALGYGRTGVARRRRLPCPTFTIVNPLALRHSVRGTPRAGGGGPFRRAAAGTAAGDGAGTRTGRGPP